MHAHRSTIALCRRCAGGTGVPMLESSKTIRKGARWFTRAHKHAHEYTRMPASAQTMFIPDVRLILYSKAAHTYIDDVSVGLHSTFIVGAQHIVLCSPQMHLAPRYGLVPRQLRTAPR